MSCCSNVPVLHPTTLSSASRGGWHLPVSPQQPLPIVVQSNVQSIRGGQTSSRMLSTSGLTSTRTEHDDHDDETPCWTAQVTTLRPPLSEEGCAVGHHRSPNHFHIEGKAGEPILLPWTATYRPSGGPLVYIEICVEEEALGNAERNHEDDDDDDDDDDDFDSSRRTCSSPSTVTLPVGLWIGFVSLDGLAVARSENDDSLPSTPSSSLLYPNWRRCEGAGHSAHVISAAAGGSAAAHTRNHSVRSVGVTVGPEDGLVWHVHTNGGGGTSEPLSFPSSQSVGNADQEHDKKAQETQKTQKAIGVLWDQLLHTVRVTVNGVMQPTVLTLAPESEEGSLSSSSHRMMQSLLSHAPCIAFSTDRQAHETLSRPGWSITVIDEVCRPSSHPPLSNRSPSSAVVLPSGWDVCRYVESAASQAVAWALRDAEYLIDGSDAFDQTGIEQQQQQQQKQQPAIVGVPQQEGERAPNEGDGLQRARMMQMISHRLASRGMTRTLDAVVAGLGRAVDSTLPHCVNISHCASRVRELVLNKHSNNNNDTPASSASLDHVASLRSVLCEWWSLLSSASPGRPSTPTYHADEEGQDSSALPVPSSFALLPAVVRSTVEALSVMEILFTHWLQQPSLQVRSYQTKHEQGDDEAGVTRGDDIGIDDDDKDAGGNPPGRAPPTLEKVFTPRTIAALLGNGTLPERSLLRRLLLLGLIGLPPSPSPASHVAASFTTSTQSQHPTKAARDGGDDGGCVTMNGCAVLSKGWLRSLQSELRRRVADRLLRLMEQHHNDTVLPQERSGEEGEEGNLERHPMSASKSTTMKKETQNTTCVAEDAPPLSSSSAPSPPPSSGRTFTTLRSSLQQTYVAATGSRPKWKSVSSLCKTFFRFRCRRCCCGSDEEQEQDSAVPRRNAKRGRESDGGAADGGDDGDVDKGHRCHHPSITMGHPPTVSVSESNLLQRHLLDILHSLT